MLVDARTGTVTSTVRRPWVVSQVGRREHYSVAAAAHSIGRLGSLYTDVWRPSQSLIARLPKVSARWRQDIPESLVISRNVRSLVRHGAWYGKARLTDSPIIPEVWYGEAFGRWAASAFIRRWTPDPPELVYAYGMGALEMLRAARELGSCAILNQYDPGMYNFDISAQEAERWPHWAAGREDAPREYVERLQAELAEADVIVVNSQWSRTCLIDQGVAPARISVVPLIYEGAKPAGEREMSHRDRPLRCLYMGRVVLVKGIQYLYEAAARMPFANVEVRVAGALGVNRATAGRTPPNLRLLGPVAHGSSRWHDLYSWADVFVFPTLSDGFGLTQLEAMAHGLPVIATRNCGRVVEHGANGLIIDARSSDAIAEALTALEQDRGWLMAMSSAASKTVAEFSSERLSADLAALADGMVGYPRLDRSSS